MANQNVSFCQLSFGRPTFAFSSVLEVELNERESSPYETHPSLPDRIASLNSVSGKMVSEGDEPAIALLRDLPQLENEIMLSFR